MGESYYDLLGVDADATTDEIEQAYREKLKETHPDVSDDEDANERTRRIIDAKEVLTDESERERYDRLGHDAYVTAESAVQGPSGDSESETSDSSKATNRHGASSTSAGEESTAGPTENTDDDDWARGAQRSSATGFSDATSTGSGAGGRTGHRRRRSRHVRDESWNTDEESDDGQWSTWNTEGSFAVRRDEGGLGGRQVLASQQSMVTLAVTFFVYPILLFGALLPTFPLAINITVGICIVLMVAFLQSIPDVAVALFGVWSFLMPVLLFGVFGVNPLSLVSLAALGSVFLPFGFSVLTWVAMRPVTAT